MAYHNRGNPFSEPDNSDFTSSHENQTDLINTSSNNSGNLGGGASNNLSNPHSFDAEKGDISNNLFETSSKNIIDEFYEKTKASIASVGNNANSNGNDFNFPKDIGSMKSEHSYSSADTDDSEVYQRQSYIESFERLCDRCYLNADSFAQMALYAIENTKSVNIGAQDMVNGLTPEHQNAEYVALVEIRNNSQFTLKSIIDELQAIGLSHLTVPLVTGKSASSLDDNLSTNLGASCDSGLASASKGKYQFRFLYTEDLPKYLSIKNLKRQEFHSITEQRIIEEFQRYIEKYTNDEKVLTLDERITLLKTYLNTYKTHIPAHPFLQGLESLLGQQIGKKFCCEWTFVDAVLTQGGHDYLRDSIKLLFRLDITTPITHGVDHTDDRIWSCKGNLTDTDLKQLTSLFPDSKKFHGRPTGTIETGDGKREACMKHMRISSGDSNSTSSKRSSQSIFSIALHTILSCCGSDSVKQVGSQSLDSIPHDD